MLIRRERPEDVADIHAVTTAAFSRPGEATLLGRLREDQGWIPELSLVAEDDGTIVGHLVATRGDVAGQPALGLGPVSVSPERQRGGIGSALIHALLGAADAMGEQVVVLLGSPAYYGRFGFVPASSLGIESPDPGWGDDDFQARPLAAYEPGLRGPFRFAAPFRL